jgi:hypothetical protein
MVEKIRLQLSSKETTEPPLTPQPSPGSLVFDPSASLIEDGLAMTQEDWETLLKNAQVIIYKKGK